MPPSTPSGQFFPACCRARSCRNRGGLIDGLANNRRPGKALDQPSKSTSTRLNDQLNEASTDPFSDSRAFGHSNSRTRTQFRSDSGTVNPLSPTSAAVYTVLNADSNSDVSLLSFGITNEEVA